jgi:hypothetical protein
MEKIEIFIVPQNIEAWMSYSAVESYELEKFQKFIDNFCSVEIGSKSIQISQKYDKIELFDASGNTTKKFHVIEYDQASEDFKSKFRTELAKKLDPVPTWSDINKEISKLSNVSDEVEQAYFTRLHRNVCDKQTTVYSFGNFFNGILSAVKGVSFKNVWDNQNFGQHITTAALYEYLSKVVKMPQQYDTDTVANSIFLLGMMTRIQIQEITVIDVCSGLLCYPMIPNTKHGQMSLWRKFGNTQTIERYRSRM